MKGAGKLVEECIQGSQANNLRQKWTKMLHALVRPIFFGPYYNSIRKTDVNMPSESMYDYTYFHPKKNRPHTLMRRLLPPRIAFDNGVERYMSFLKRMPSWLSTKPIILDMSC